MHDKNRKELLKILSMARSPAELESLLDGLLTPQEIEELVKRWKLMCRLVEEMPQRRISHELGVSLGKIARGSRLVKYGPEPFRRLLKRSLKPSKDAS
jgi:TrpR family transcriptional regulator, trp operon repressor